MADNPLVHIICFVILQRDMYMTKSALSIGNIAGFGTSEAFLKNPNGRFTCFLLGGHVIYTLSVYLSLVVMGETHLILLTTIHFY
jgi:hypothetical protein